MNSSADKLLDGTIRDANIALRNSDVTAAGLLEAAVERHQANENLHAYKFWDGRGAAARAEAADKAFAAGCDMGPLQGIPVSVKDLYGIGGLPIFAGSPRELPEKWRTEGPIVRALKNQLSVITGKSHTVEFALGILGLNHHWGTPYNPWDAEDHRAPGGSSCGAGVSLIEGSAMVALGTDTAGSVRSPASMTGNVGIKPSAGRWSTDGIVPLSSSLDSPGPLARSVEDAALAFAVIDPYVSDVDAFLSQVDRTGISGIRVGVCDGFFFDDCSPGIAEAVEASVEQLSGAGAIVGSCIVPGTDEAIQIQMKGGLAAAEFSAFISSELPEWQETLEENVRARIELAKGMPAVEYIGRGRALGRIATEANVLFESHDVLVSPTLANTPPRIADVADEASYNRETALALRNTAIANLYGWCAVTMPCGLDGAGMPVGLQVMARGGDEEKLIAVCRAFEKVLGTGRERLGRAPALKVT